MAVRSKARAKLGNKAVKRPARKSAKKTTKKVKKKAKKKAKKKVTKKATKKTSKGTGNRLATKTVKRTTKRSTLTPPTSTTKSAGIGDDAVLKATGKRWADWLTLLDKAGGSGWTHRRIALYLHEQKGVNEWWSQMVAVGYEQARGLREKHQTATGFNANLSRTFDQPLTEMYERWADEKKRRRWLDARGYFIRKANENKSLRITWEDGSSVEIYFWAKGPARTLVQVEQHKLSDAAAVDRAKSFWKLQFAALEKGV